MTGVLLKSLFSVGTKLFMSMAGEKAIEWALFHVAESVVKSTKTKHDDEFLAIVKEAYKKAE